MEFPVSSRGVVGRTQTLGLLGLDPNMERLRLFIKLLRYIADTDITGQIQFPRNIIHG